MVLLLGSGTFAAYQIFETAREAVLAFGAPNLSPIAFSETPEPTRANPNISAGERVNVLALGWDKRPVDLCPCQTDTMMIVTLDPKTSIAGRVTIPRDLWVPIPGIHDQRIDTA